MARQQEVTVVQRIAMLTAMVTSRANQIATYLDTIESLEKHIPKGLELELFRLSVRSIRADVNSLANDDERTAPHR